MAEVRKAVRAGAETTTPAAAPPSVAPDLPSLPGYEIVEELGRGGMGVVYKARQLSLNRFVALKMILAGPYADEDQLARFRAEAEAVARLQHPGIVQIHEIGSHAGHAYLALEYVPGGTLVRKCAGRPLPPTEAAGLVASLARAMHYAHRCGIVHRDLKPGNVLLAEDGQPKIADFGLAKRLDADAGSAAPGPQTQSGAILGTPAYMAPEQAGGKRGAVGPAADVYALGAILYDLLTGRPPFRADNAVDVIFKVITEQPIPPRRIEPACPRDLEVVCLKCLNKDPARRYESAAALVGDLTRFLAGEPIRARPATAGERFRLWAGRRLWWLGGAAAAGLLLLLAGSLALKFAGVFSPKPAPPAGKPLSGPRAPHDNPENFSPRVRPNDIYKYALKSTAWVIANDREGAMTGTGTLIDRDNRLVLTNYHVVGSRVDFVVFFPRYDEKGKLIAARDDYLAPAARDAAIKGRVVARDQKRDLALIQLERIPDGIEALPFAKSDPAQGEDVYSVGNPGASGSLWVYAKGVVRSSVYVKQWKAGSPDALLDYKARVLETDTPTNPGDSGGPCVNDRGELVGIALAGMRAINPIALFIAYSEAEDFIGESFEAPPLAGAKWVRAQRPPPVPDPLPGPPGRQ
jgi:serine/threonine-protein kinase